MGASRLRRIFLGVGWYLCHTVLVVLWARTERSSAAVSQQIAAYGVLVLPDAANSISNSSCQVASRASSSEALLALQHDMQRRHHARKPCDSG